MIKCWKVEITERPSFKVLFESIESLWFHESTKLNLPPVSHLEIVDQEKGPIVYHFQYLKHLVYK